jgi:hypothetical protein
MFSVLILTRDEKQLRSTDRIAFRVLGCARERHFKATLDHCELHHREKVDGVFSNLVPIRRHSFSQPIVCSPMLRRL